MIDDRQLQIWFNREIFPLEGALTRYIRRHWRNESDVGDLRQEIYVRIYSSAKRQLPAHARAFLFTTARNHLINVARSARVVSLDIVADLEASFPGLTSADLDRQLSARDELRRVQLGLERLSPRCRQVMVLRRVEGLSTREVAERLGISAKTVENQLVHGMRALTDFMMGGEGRIRRSEHRRARAVEGKP
ncbi:MAG: RNA polymerase sigma factor [Caulobacterales bacterium]|nr:RNA polymerase sigma factor [Caulobacterales bacterium]